MFRIQSYYRQYIISKTMKKKVRERAAGIKVYTSRMSHDQAVHSRTARLLSLLKDFKTWPKVVDLVRSNNPQSVESFRRFEIPLSNYKLPILMIDTICIGELSDVEHLHDLMDRIIERGKRELKRFYDEVYTLWGEESRSASRPKV